MSGVVIYWDKRNVMLPKYRAGHKISTKLSLFRFLICVVIGYCFTSTLRVRCPVRNRTTKHEELDKLMANMGDDEEDLSSSISNDSYKKLLLVGVLTTEANLETRAKAIYDTWAHSLPGRVLFFVGKGSTYNGSLPVIVLDDVIDQEYPPRQKSFRMLQYMYTHHGGDFHFYVRADDDIYIKGKKLARLLSSIDSSRSQYIGQSGEGIPEEMGLLGLSDDRPYCMGGPGVILSKESLKNLGPYIDACLNSAASTHEDTEVGRCVHRYVGIACTRAYEWGDLLYQNFRERKGSFTHELGSPEIAAVTLHPVKSAPYVYRLHNFVLQGMLKKLKQQIMVLVEETEEMRSLMGISSQNNNKKGISMNENTLKWFAFDKVYYRDETEDVRSSKTRKVNDKIIDRKVLSIIRRFRKNRPVVDIKMLHQVAAYQRVVPNKGVDSSLQYALSYSYERYQNKKRSTLPLRFHQPFNDLEVTENILFKDVKSTQTPSVVNVILPLKGRHHILQMFLDNYVRIALSKQVETTLTILLYRDETVDTEKNSILVKKTQTIHPDVKITVVYKQGDRFNRGIAIHEGTIRFNNDSLLLFMDVDTKFTSDFFRRVQLNTVRGFRVFFPISFSLYNPEIVCGSPKCFTSSLDFGSNIGIWRSFGYGMVGIYKSDYINSGGFDMNIDGWGSEDLDLNNKVINAGLDVMRAPDPGLAHMYHEKICSQDLPIRRYKSCQDSKAHLWASQQQFADLARYAGVLVSPDANNGEGDDPLIVFARDKYNANDDLDDVEHWDTLSDVMNDINKIDVNEKT